MTSHRESQDISDNRHSSTNSDHSFGIKDESTIETNQESHYMYNCDSICGQLESQVMINTMQINHATTETEDNCSVLQDIADSEVASGIHDIGMELEQETIHPYNYIYYKMRSPVPQEGNLSPTTSAADGMKFGETPVTAAAKSLKTEIEEKQRSLERSKVELLTEQDNYDDVQKQLNDKVKFMTEIGLRQEALNTQTNHLLEEKFKALSKVNSILSSEIEALENINLEINKRNSEIESLLKIARDKSCDPHLEKALQKLIDTNKQELVTLKNVAKSLDEKLRIITQGITNSLKDKESATYSQSTVMSGSKCLPKTEKEQKKAAAFGDNSSSSGVNIQDNDTIWKKEILMKQRKKQNTFMKQQNTKKLILRSMSSQVPQEGNLSPTTSAADGMKFGETPVTAAALKNVSTGTIRKRKTTRTKPKHHQRRSNQESHNMFDCEDIYGQLESQGMINTMHINHATTETEDNCSVLQDIADSEVASGIYEMGMDLEQETIQKYNYIQENTKSLKTEIEEKQRSLERSKVELLTEQDNYDDVQKQLNDKVKFITEIGLRQEALNTQTKHLLEEKFKVLSKVNSILSSEIEALEIKINKGNSEIESLLKIARDKSCDPHLVKELQKLNDTNKQELVTLKIVAKTLDEKLRTITQGITNSLKDKESATYSQSTVMSGSKCLPKTEKEQKKATAVGDNSSSSGVSLQDNDTIWKKEILMKQRKKQNTFMKQQNTKKLIPRSMRSQVPQEGNLSPTTSAADGMKFGETPVSAAALETVSTGTIPKRKTTRTTKTPSKKVKD